MTKHKPLTLEQINDPNLLAQVYEDYRYTHEEKLTARKKVERFIATGERRVRVISYITGVSESWVYKITADIRKEANDHNLQHSNMRDLQNG